MLNNSLNTLKNIGIAAVSILFYGFSMNAVAANARDIQERISKCAPDVSAQTMAALIATESSFNPFAIGVVGGRLERQPSNKDAAIETAKALDKAGLKYSAGVAQIFRGNWGNYGLTHETVFDVCPNIRAGSHILKNCYVRAKHVEGSSQTALRMAFSCYYSNNFVAGFKPGPGGVPSYVEKILHSAARIDEPVPPIKFIPDTPATKQQKPSEAKEVAPIEIDAEEHQPEFVNFDVNGTHQKAEEKEKMGGADDTPFVYGSEEEAENDSTDMVF